MKSFNDPYSLPNIFQVIKARIIKWVGHVACTGRGFWWGNLRERDHLEEPGIDGTIILRGIFRKWAGRHCCKVVHKASTVTFNSTHIARAINRQRPHQNKKKEKRKLFSSYVSVLTRK